MALSKEFYRQLYEIAESQDGFFTARQALLAGYSDRMQVYHIQNGDWTKEARGIYRLNCYPPSYNDYLMPWYLWSCNRLGTPQGIYSHDTALRIYNLSTWNSPKLHMTVPNHFRRSVIPKVIILYREDLNTTDINIKYNVQVTSPIKTILDLLVQGEIPRKYLQEALFDALENQLILPDNIKQLNPDHLAIFKKLYKEIKNDGI